MNKLTKDLHNFTLGDISSLSQGLAINSKTKHLLKDVGIPLLRITDLINNKVEQYIDINNAPKKCIVSKNEIIYTRTGQVGLVFNDRNGVIHNNCFKVIPDESIVNKSFLYWFLSQKKIKDYANSIASGSVQKDLNHSSFASIPIKLPNLEYQQRAATILNSLREKIELNQKMIKTIKEIEKALFKSWFIDFDPVKAKAEGKSSKLSKELDDLFPNSFQNSKLGDIPKDWKISKIGDVMDFIYGSAMTKTNRKKGSIPVYGSNGVVGFHNEKNSDGPGIIIGRAGNPGAVHWSYENFFIIDSAFSIKIKNNYKQNFYYYVLKNLNLKRLNTGSAVPGLNRNHAYAELFTNPGKKIIEKFNELSSVYKDVINNKNKKINVLRKMRDQLLTKLISGKIKIHN
jgi:type I restriction enzyme, S subunit